ncbi:alpha-amylase family glycosyl hydrolase [Paludisphaera rhizosphaerae]|uniref:alpha-amylase family glycosyl hydrolase n=1 Tax=Paludisphaera rhizosphaerae TaxID=2711216 RepID=UPI0013EDE6A6|nr:alpha-amylase family glycosyl hydrolase [Paludisphaera rhizosphaerae]
MSFSRRLPRSFARRLLTALAVVTSLVGIANAALAAPLGPSLDATGGVTFRVYSAPATRIEVWIYANPEGEAEKLALPLDNDPTSHVWSKTVSAADLQSAGLSGAVFYGYRAWGPNWPYVASWKKGTADGFVSDVDDKGNRFNPNKLLLDPYAREVSHDARNQLHPNGDLYLSGSAHRADDTGIIAPKGVVLADVAVDVGVHPQRTLKDDLIYEVHLRGLTAQDAGVPAAERGTYAGAARKAAALKDLGVTAVEFLPIYELQNDQNDLTPGSAVGDNYWGYDPDSFFSPDRRYAANKSWGGPTREFKQMVRAFHDAGIKVILDVVYNHTGEGDVDKETGSIASILSWRGLDNATYYELRDDNAPYQDDGRPNRWLRNGYYANNNGVGPNVNTAAPVTRDLVLDSLKYWTEQMGVDGFRFDLAAVLGNSQTHGDFSFDNSSTDGFLKRAVADLPARGLDGSGVDLIAEPYGAKGFGTFQLGQFPFGWTEWDDRFRYPIRQKQNKLGIGGNEVSPAQLITLFAGSSDIFQASGRKPYNGVNYIVAHDGFTLRDLYSFLHKQNNQPFPLGPSAGGADDDRNISWDQGGDPALQRQAARTGLALLLVSAGVPMIVGGDEMYRSQLGNNNPFNLDNDRFYLDYDLQTRFPHHLAYAKAMFQFRRDHAALRRGEFFDGRDHNANGLKDVTWIRDDGQEADGAYLDNTQNHFIAFRLDGTEAADASPSILVAYNAFSADITATLPANLPGNRWHLVVDTSAALENHDNIANPPLRVDASTYKTTSRSVAVFVEKP